MFGNRFTQAMEGGSETAVQVQEVPAGFTVVPAPTLAALTPELLLRQQLLYALALERAKAVVQPSLLERALVTSIN